MGYFVRKRQIRHRRQEKDHFCGPAVLQMILEYFGIGMDQEKLAEECDTTEKDGTPNDAMVRVMRSYGLAAHARTGSSLREVKRSIGEGSVVAVNFINPADGEGHYAIAVKVRLFSIELEDPWNGKSFRMSHKRFERAWHGMNGTNERWMMTVAERPTR